MEIYVGEAFAELRAHWSQPGEDGATMKRARQEEQHEVQLWEVMAKIRELAPLVNDVQELRRELDARKVEVVGAVAAVCDKEGEYAGLVQEAASEGTFPVNAATIVKLQGAQCPVCVVNVRSGMTHAVDLAYLATVERGRWCAACGWRFREGDAVFSVGPPAGLCCAKAGCAVRFEELLKADCDERDEDGEEDGHVG